MHLAGQDYEHTPKNMAGKLRRQLNKRGPVIPTSPALPYIKPILNVHYSEYTLGHHGTGYLHEAGHIGAFHVVHKTIGLGAMRHTLGVDIRHDILEPGVNLGSTP